MSNKSGSERVVEGYIYIYPYAGDDIFIHPEKVDPRSPKELSRIHSEAWFEDKGMSFLEILSKLEGKKVKVIIEEKRIVIEIQE